MKKIAFGYVLGLMILLQGIFVLNAHAQLPLPDQQNYDSAIRENRVINKIQTQTSTSGSIITQNTENILVDIFTRGTNGNVSFVLGFNAVVAAIAITWITVLAVKFISSQGEEEKITTYKKEFGYIVLGLFLVSIAQFAAFTLLNPTSDIIKDDQDEFIRQLYTRVDVAVAFVRYFIGGIMIIIGGMSGYKLVTSGDQDEKRQSEKTFLKAFIIGSIFILLAETMVRIFALETRTGIEISTGQATTIGIVEITGIINFILGFVGALGFISLLIASLYYLISFGQEEQVSKAKKMIIYSIIAIVVSISAYSLSSYFVENYKDVGPQAVLIQNFLT